MYPHQKLDWTAGRLEARLAEHPEDTQARLELARVALSRGLWHGGGEAQCSLALQHARKLLASESSANPVSADVLAAATVIAGAALVGLDRPEAAQKFLDEGVRMAPERADLHFALGAMYRGQGDRHLAIRHLETSCRAAPTAWEVHLLLGRTLAERARQVADNQRLIERSQYHLVQALKLEPPPELTHPLLRDLGASCLATGRHAEAEKLFVRLKEHPKYTAIARRHLGEVAFALGKYKNAIQHFRHYLESHGDDVNVIARMGMSYLHLGELERAREHCNRALLLDPRHLGARHALACTMIEEGQAGDAMRVLKETLEDNPEDMGSYVELARLRRRLGDVPWLQRALESECQSFDRLPVIGGEVSPRSLTRRRIEVLLDELRAVGPSSIATVLGSIELADDEGLRFLLWEAACSLAGAHVADEVGARLREPGRYYGLGLARNALAAAAWLPEPTLTAGLNVTLEDIQRATTERRGAQPDLAAHRRAVEAEREVARAYQAILLLAIATRKSRSARQLLASWGKDADPELAAAVLAAQVVSGEPEAARALSRRAQERGAGTSVERLLAQVSPGTTRGDPQPLRDGNDAHCTSCGRTGADATHLIAGTRALLCDHCVAEVARNRRALLAPDDAACHLCGRTQMETRGVYRYHGVDVCTECIDLSIGLLEREDVERFLAAW